MQTLHDAPERPLRRLQDTIPMTVDTPHSGRTWTSWWREAVRVLAGLVVFGVLAVLVREHFGAARTWLEGLGGWAPAAFVVIHVVTVMLGFPASVLGFLAGANFGVLGGSLLLLLAGLSAATVMFMVSRWLFQGRVHRYAAARPRLARFMELAEGDSLRVMVLLRLSPLHFGLVCYLLGASRVRFAPYLATSALLLPSAILQAYMGHTIVRVGERAAAGQELASMETVMAAVGIVAAALLLALMGQMARRALQLENDPAREADDRS
ncbi:hypothetical protein GF314_14030 [bacterium]|nr:hypothetical protein [bacterium]